MNQSINLRSIIIVLGLLLSLAVLVFAGTRVYSLFVSASGSPPEDVRIGNITANSATVTFTTTSSAQALIEYGTNPTNLTLFASDETSTTDHTIRIALLTPNTTYYFHIKMGEKKYDNAGLPWTFTTTTVGTSSPNPTQVQLTPAVTDSPSSTTSAGSINCNEIPKHIGATQGSPNYDAQFDINRDGIINVGDITACK